MCDGFEAVVDVEGRDHHEKTVCVDGADQGGDYEAVPALVRIVFERVSSVSEEKWDGNHIEVFESHGVVFLGLFLGLGKNVLVFEGDAVGDDRVGCVSDSDVDDRGDFPEFEEDAHSLGEEDHPACEIVSYILIVGHEIWNLLVFSLLSIR